MRVRGDSAATARRQHRGRVFRYSVSALMSVFACVVMSTTSALASNGNALYCFDNTTGLRYPSHGSSTGNGVPYWYAQIQTGTSNSPVYATEGGKANLTTGGQPYVYDSVNQHVAEYVGSGESYVVSHQIQTGWILGQFNECNGNYVITSGIEVYVEIYDDTSSPCYASLFGTAPSNASYDARYYTTTGGGLYQYNAYYQAPGSSTIQDLGYGDYHDLKTSEFATGEVQAPTTGSQSPSCPILGRTQSGDWNLMGNPNSNTFASYLQLYVNGSWVNWTSSAVSTSTLAEAPYQLKVISSYTEIENGGGQQ